MSKKINSVLFSPAELRQVLSAYSEGVLTKGWKDYGLQTLPNETSFAVIERGLDSQGVAAFLCSLKKVAGKTPHYIVYEGEKPVLRSKSFLESLERFRRIGLRGGGLKIVQ